MEKTFVVMEVKLHPLYENRYSPVGMKQGDDTVIDPRHVIDGDLLKDRITRIITTDRCGWCLSEYVNEAIEIILEPPKPEGDEWEKDLEEAVHMISDVLHSLLQRMPRKP